MLFQSRLAAVTCSMKIDTLVPAALTPQEVLEILRDNVRQNPYAFIDDPNTELLMSTSVRDWQIDADLLPWDELADAFNSYWQMNVSRDEWEQVLAPESKKTVGHICELIASHAQIENVDPPSLFGRQCVPAGVFFAVRTLLSRGGADVANLTPSSELRSYAIQHPDVFVNEISRLAPGRLPAIQMEHPSDRWLLVLMVAWVSLMISAAVSPFVPWLWIPVLIVAVGAYAALNLTSRMEPTNVQFGSLQTFRDLCYQLAPGIRT